MKTMIQILAFLLLPFTAYSGGFVIISQGNTGQLNGTPQRQYTLECRSLSVHTDIKDQVAVTTMEQVFFNTTTSRLEGYFMFPVPKGSVIRDFRMEINGVMMQAEMLEADKARKIYEDIVRSMKDPALLEYAEQDLFRLRIFPIEPNSEKRIKITYTELLQKESGTYEYVFPLNTKKFSAAPLQNVTIQVDIEGTSPIKTIYSPTHEVEMIRKNATVGKVGYESRQTSPDTDFKLYYSTSASILGISFMTTKENNEDGFFFADISPGYISPNHVMPKDITLILDVSGSMAGDKMQQAKNALKFCVENLNPGDCFEIIAFSTEARALFGQRVEYNEKTKKEALDFIDGLKAIGGTNMDEAFQLCMKEKTQHDRPSMIIFITDGKPTIGETDETQLLNKIDKMNMADQRIFTFGVGYDLNARLLDKITENGHGYRTYVTPEEDIEVKISDFFTKVSSPVLSDIKISFADGSGVYGMFPKSIPDLFRGSSITLFGKYRKPGKTDMLIEGKVNGQPVAYTYTVELGDNSDKHDFIAPLWATRHVGYLLDQIRLHGETRELKEEIVALAKEYGIITPYTSYLILEDEQVLSRNNTISKEQQLFMPRVNNDFTKFEKNFEDLKSTSGKGSVDGSVQVQRLNLSNNTEQMKKSGESTGYVDQNGEFRNLSDETRNVNGRAMYQVGKEWVDVDVQKNNNYKTHKIKFASEEYFKLLDQQPDVSNYLALGKNLRFVYNSEIIEVYE